MPIQCQILMGATVPMPLSLGLMKAVREIEVVHNDLEQSGFQITFAIGRSKALARMDYPMLESAQIKPYSRVQLLITYNAIPRMIMDGFITHIQTDPDYQLGTATVTLTGKDITVMMDREEKVALYQSQADHTIVRNILQKYQQYNLNLEIVASPIARTQHVSIQRGTDLDYIQLLAKRHYYVFYIDNDAKRRVNTAYWGPPKRIGMMQKALSVGLGPNSNIGAVQFNYDALAADTYYGQILDAPTNQSMPIETLNSIQVPLSKSALQRNNRQKVLLTDVAGQDFAEVVATMQAKTNASAMDTVEVTGELDILRYGSILQARSLVGLRGAGMSYDGQYYVKQVSHIFKAGSYRQRFILARDGIGTTVPAVIP